MLKIVCINVMIAAVIMWASLYMLLSIFPSCYEWQESTPEQDVSNAKIGQRNRKIDTISMQESINRVNIDQHYMCKRWAVVYAMSYPTNAVRQIALDNNWCIVIVADIDSISMDAYLTALGIRGRRIVFLNVDDQDILFSDLTAAIPLRHIGRKNVGYLFAMQNGAELIWDFDYNNQGILDINISNTRNTIDVLQRCSGKHKLFNPYPYFSVNETCIWPRGFPLEFVRDTSTSPELCKGNISVESVGVFQSIAKTELDVDATFRLTREYPVMFETAQTFPFILIPRHSYCPFSERATLWTKQAFLYMALPTGVNSRVSDIWRSYIAQLFFHQKDINLVFSPPIIEQTSRDETILEDLQAEMDIYKKSNSLIDFLQTFTFYHNTTLENLYEDLYSRHFITLNDVYFIRKWVKSYSKVFIVD
ncbi:hypothetical protein ACJMK2_006391 [Sinanodonta woodiana]|uniref:Uncharacterized protein n=1 Tax=Sinanodonta woodiana TaxID=1069815 RepID=A0ABD3VT04_SINWO